MRVYNASAYNDNCGNVVYSTLKGRIGVDSYLCEIFCDVLLDTNREKIRFNEALDVIVFFDLQLEKNFELHTVTYAQFLYEIKPKEGIHVLLDGGHYQLIVVGNIEIRDHLN